MRKIAIVLMCFVFVCGVAFAAEKEEPLVPLKVYYLEFPPYYHTNVDRLPDGFLLRNTSRILHKAGIKPCFRGMPAKRILQEMRSSEPLVSIGWFKTPRREVFAKFSLPIYKNKPLEILFLKENEAQFSHYDQLSELLHAPDLVLGVLEGYSLGNVVDTMISDAKPQKMIASGGYPQLVRMLAAGRFSYLIVAPEEVDVLITKNYLSEKLFARKKLTDMPPGNLRYLMFSQAVSDEIIERVNNAIQELGF